MKRLRWATFMVVALTLMMAVRADAQDVPITGTVQPLQADGGWIDGLSPDGSKIAVLTPSTSICIFDTTTLDEISCAQLDRLDSDPGSDGIVWSPDSTRLAITEIGLLVGRDGDLWVMDAVTGDLTNLTDDRFSGYLPTVTSSETIYVDTSASWTPDGQHITFARSAWSRGNPSGTTIAQISASGGDIETLADVDTRESGVVRARTGWSPGGDTFFFTVDAGSPQTDGIWTYTQSTGETALLAATEDPELGVLAFLEISPANDQILAWYPAAQGRFDVDSILLRLIDLETGAIASPVLPDSSSTSTAGLASATFAPDGSGLLVLVSAMGVSDQLWLAVPATGTPELILAETMVDTGTRVDWAIDGTVAIGGLYGQGSLTSIAVSSSSGGTVSVTELAIPDAQILGASPDGSKIAVLRPRVSLCVLDTVTWLEISCGSLEERSISPQANDVVWSPDSTRIAFTELGFAVGTDSDLWVMDTATGSLTNLTDDGYDGPIYPLNADAAAATFAIDTSPAWTPDGTSISFGRTGWSDGESTGTVLAQVAANGGAVEELARISDTEPGVVFSRSAWSPDGFTLYYTYRSALADDPKNGIWTYDAITGQIDHLTPADGLLGGAPILLQVSPTGGELLVWYPEVLWSDQMADPLIRLVDPVSGETMFPALPPPGQATLPSRVVATFSPDGTELLFLLVSATGSGQLWTADPATGEFTKVVDQIEDARLDPALPLIWSANGMVAVGKTDGSAAIVMLGGEPMNDEPDPAASLRGGVTVHNSSRDAHEPSAQKRALAPHPVTIEKWSGLEPVEESWR